MHQQLLSSDQLILQTQCMLLFWDTFLSLLCITSSQERCPNLLVYITRMKKGNLHLLFGKQHIPPLVDLPDESLCFSHTVVALPFPLQMLNLKEIQLGSRESTETSETQGE